MENFNKVAIDINENGYTVTVLEPPDCNGKQFVFGKSKQMRDWLKDNLSPTGEVKRFSDALDNEGEYNETVFDSFSINPQVFGNGFCSTTSTMATS